ncbi:MAG: hypothetical protein RRB22_10460 [Gammaproteobacteria bacterium]|nr:hypothetical protein [Gammaproteobacteria bacterium]
MRSTRLIIRQLFSCLFVLVAFYPASVLADDLDAIVIPSLMDQQLDAWYRVPLNSGPRIQKADKVTHGQTFMLLTFFKGYTTDKDNHIHLRYDVQIYGPDGKPTEDKGVDMEVYKGPAGNSNALMLNRQYMLITFTDAYPVGTYSIKMTGYDKVENTSVVKETTIELVPFSLGEAFPSIKEVGSWMMAYYKSPEPMRSIQAIRASMKTETKWLNKNMNVATFFMYVFSNNSFLSHYIVKHMKNFSLEDRKKLLLIAVLSGDDVLTQALLDTGDLDEIHDYAKGIKLPEKSEVVRHAAYLDVYWSEFLATGRYEPIKKIVGALALHQYKGSIEQYKATSDEERTDALKEKTYFEAVYQSAVWSLISNSKQMPQVFKYCVFIYQNEKLEEGVKKELGVLLSIVQQEMKKTRSAEKQKVS